ncbi:MAG: hypothetical protein LBD71_04450 [Treponema sp.]|nr:hypothetical protein [Treponema sp.]
MNRKASVLAVLLVTAGLGLSAQEIKFDGYLNSGFGVVITDRQAPKGPLPADGSRTVSPYITAFGVDSEQWGYRFRLNGSFTGESKNYGAKFRLQGQSKSTGDSYPPFTLPIAMGWASAFNGILTMNAGIIDDGTWASGGGILNDDMGEGLGGLLKVSPVKALDLGFGVYGISTDSGGNNSRLTKGLDKNRVEVYYAKYTLNLGFTLPETFKFTATWRNMNNAGGSSGASLGTGRDETSKMIIGARMLAVKNLTAVLEAELDNLQDFRETKTGEKNGWGVPLTAGANSSGKFNLYETIGFKTGDLGAGLNAAQYFSLQKKVTDGDNKTGPGLRFNPWVSYSLGGVVPRLDFVYFAAGKINGSDNDDEGKFHRKGYDPTYFTGDSVVTIRPSVTFNVGNAALEIGDAVNIENNHTKKYYGSSTRADDRRDRRITNILYVDCKWSF